ncbi:terminase small subunit [Mesorhizobium yinganensis]|uniref:terminase small subunit n=1 Tax=Mesorhizobium yinganensis TaxID=3157707 RepID=UPI0032B7795B
MSLNARQEKFVQNLVVNGLVASAAYKTAGYAGRTDGAARAGASELLTNPNVRARLAQLQQQAAMRAAVLETIAAELDAAYELAFANKQAAACVA